MNADFSDGDLDEGKLLSFTESVTSPSNYVAHSKTPRYCHLILRAGNCAGILVCPKCSVPWK